MTDPHRELVLDDQHARREMQRRTRRGFVIGGLSALAGTAGLLWLTNSAEEGGTPWPQRRVLDFNARLWHTYLNDARLMPSYAPKDVRPLKPNGDIGLTDPIDAAWKIDLTTGFGPVLTLGLADVQALPRVEMITRFCCIEGWSTVTRWTGARFSDFTRKFFPQSHPLPRYVYLTTPDNQYYVGLDMKSALHPQTLLAYEHDGAPLTPEHGAPLRLVTPIKYGIKNIKRIGGIQFTDKRPRDYWADEGYDWFAGL
jgi:DMSO/TMAO reductase YedYZ molybdopterin-dependent catalytic subunit